MEYGIWNMGGFRRKGLASLVLGLGLAVVVLLSLTVKQASAMPLDACFEHRKWTYNEQYFVWVADNTMYRCVNINGELSARTGDESGISSRVPMNDKTLCVGKQEEEIVVQGVIQYADDGGYNGRIWDDDCRPLGTVFSKNTESITTRTGRIADPTQNRGSVSFNEDEDFTESDASDPGFRVNSTEFDITGISKERDLRGLIIGFTNFLLPYVSVLSVLVIVLAGFYYLASFANDELHTKAKNALLYVAIGIIILVSGYAIITALIRAAG